MQGTTCLEVLVQQDKASLGKAIGIAHAADLQHRQAVAAAKPWARHRGTSLLP